MTVKPPVEFKKSALISLSSSDPAVIMDAIDNWFNTATAYGDGTSRSAGWASVKEQITSVTVCIRLDPPSTSTRKNQRCMMMGRATISSETPTMFGSDAYANGRMFAAQVYGPTNGSEADYVSFDNANPYGSGHKWTAWCGVMPASTTITGIEIYEGTEACIIWLRRGASNNPACVAHFGDMAENFGVAGNAEADGGRYGVAASGYNATLLTTFVDATTGSNGVLYSHSTTAGRAKFVTYTPGGARVGVDATPSGQPGSAGGGYIPPTTINLQNSNVYGRIPIHMAVGNNWIGIVRGVQYAGDSINATITSGGIVQGYFAGAQTTGTAAAAVIISRID